MDFHSLPRRDLQSLCKINKIPANMTNLAMADALKSLETVEGLDEYMNQADSNVLQSPTSVAKLPPSTATRTTRRKTAVKPEPQSSRLTSKSRDGDVEQEDVNKNVKFDVVKTPAARSTRKVSCSSKVQESKKVEMVQSAYSTRRSTRLLEKCMADLSLQTKDTLDKPEKIQETEQQLSTQEKNPAGSEERIEDAEVRHCRDLSASMEKEGEVVKNDSVVVPVLTVNDNKESKNFEAIQSLVQVDHQLTEEAIQEDVYEPEKTNTVVEETMVDQTDGNSEAEPEEDNSGVDSDEADSNQVDDQEIEQATQDNDSKLNTFDEETMLDQTNDGSELEGDDTGADSDGTISEADSYQAKQGSDIADGKVILPESEGSVTAPASTVVLEEVLVETTPLSPPFVVESVSAQFPRPNKSATKNSAMKLVSIENATKENNMEMMMMNVVNGESKDEEAPKKNKKVEIDEESLKDASMRQLVKMVKKLSIKSNNNRTALQMLPGNNQIA